MTEPSEVPVDLWMCSHKAEGTSLRLRGYVTVQLFFANGSPGRSGQEDEGRYKWHLSVYLVVQCGPVFKSHVTCIISLVAHVMP